MTFDLQPTLRGRLLELGPLRPDHWDDLFAVASDPLLWEQHPERDRYREDVFRAFFAEALASGGALVAIDRNDGRVIGSSRYFGYSEEGSEVEIGWSFLARSHWGGHYNGEMKRLMLDHAFRFVEQVVFHIGPRNLRSRRAIEKVGGVLAGSLFVRGHEAVVYRISRSSWPGSAEPPRADAGARLEPPPASDPARQAFAPAPDAAAGASHDPANAHEAAERIRRALLDAAVRAHEDAGLRGLCAEGRWEAALDALRSTSLEPPSAGSRGDGPAGRPA